MREHLVEVDSGGSPAPRWPGWGGEGGKLNVRAASLHVLGDLAAAIGVGIAAVVVLTTGWLYAGPADLGRHRPPGRMGEQLASSSTR